MPDLTDKKLYDLMKERVEKLPLEYQKEFLTNTLKYLKNIEIKALKDTEEILSEYGLQTKTGSSQNPSVFRPPMTLNELIRYEIILKNKQVTSQSLADELGTTHNLESAYLVKIIGKGYLGRTPDSQPTGHAPKSMYRPIEDAVKIIAEDMKKQNSDVDLLDDACVIELSNRIGTKHKEIVRKILKSFQ